MMHELKAFTPSQILVFANVVRNDRRLDFEFRLRDPQKLVLDSLSDFKGPPWPRADELWKTTCFEAFVSQSNSPAYWELNLSPSRKCWNLYFFTGYRTPQPPAASRDFELVNVEMTGETLSAGLQSAKDLGPLEVNLNAIMRTAAGPEYFALKHATGKADFHDRQCLRLLI
jgi:hypothetical protein